MPPISFKLCNVLENAKFWSLGGSRTEKDKGVHRLQLDSQYRSTLIIVFTVNTFALILPP